MQKAKYEMQNTKSENSNNIRIRIIKIKKMTKRITKK